ncbi:hypothetical protein [Modestobacter sp. VKM Ac-2985]|uniref:hypothetical protein n=1 Tax=Modestobacter sp. VKM Ac-2985 TaxID=3004139 RepID=UPI0022AB6B48|nr:hypothetical protein [Modestobacter sp. VKM Ac-2985]MCZ2837173.1 hypothetical protein [Modestobacter sp. VKM Ac-2985]
MSAASFTPAATLLRTAPTTPLAATPAGSVVHILNRPGGAPICHRDRQTVTPLPAAGPAPAVRVCEFCIRALPAKVRLDLVPTDVERTAVREHAARQRPEPLPLPDQGGA